VKDYKHLHMCVCVCVCVCVRAQAYTHFTSDFLTSTLNDDEHKLHRNGLSSEWHFTCLLHCDDFKNSLPHM